jgi:fucose permease
MATLRLPIVWLCVGMFLAYAGLESSASQWAPSLFYDSRGVAETLAGYWVAIYLLSFTAGRIVFGFIVDRFKTVSMIRLCLAGVVAGLLLWWWNPTVELGFVGLLLFGFTLAPIFALMITSTQDRLGPHHAPNAIGFEVAAASFGAGVLPGLAGVLAKNMSLEIVPPFLLVFGIVMTVFYEAIISPRVIVPNTPVMVSEN